MLIFLIALGIIQGLTEFLPISSSGHLAYLQNLDFFREYTARIGAAGMFSYDILLHFATLLSIVVFFYRDIKDLIMKSLLFLFGKRTEENRSQFRLALLIVLANIPIIIVGLLFKEAIEGFFQSLLAVAIFFMLNGLFLFSTRFARRGDTELTMIKGWQAISIGILQAFAVLPGISRSGSTIGAAFFAGVRAKDAARFSFLLGLPPIVGASLLELLKLSKQSAEFAYLPAMVGGMLISFITGLLALRILVWFVNKTILYPFGIYTFILGCVTVLYLIFS